jgi:hypothetical protein
MKQVAKDYFFLGLPFNPENGGDKSLKNVGLLRPN